MKELLQQLSLYNIWANQLLFELILTLPEERLEMEVPSSFNSLYKTVLHMLNAESIWWQRMKMQERIIAPAENFTGNFKELSKELNKQNKQWRDLIGNASKPMLQHEFIYYNIKKQQFKQPVYQMLLHVFNHGTYHRGQLVNMLRQLQVEKIPQTDFIVWGRMRPT